MICDLDEWFAREILPHEPSLTNYLRTLCYDRSEVLDLRQDVYVRVYESAAKSRPVQPRGFLFATARNLLIDRLRRRQVVSIDLVQDFDVLDVCIDEISPERRFSAHQELRRLSAALEELPDACRDVIWLRRIEGLSQREAAERLGMNEGTLESHLCRGVLALATAIFAPGEAKPKAAAKSLARKK